MAQETQTEPTGSSTVSQEAFDRVKHDLEQSKSEAASLKEQLAASQKVNKVESFLRDQDIPKEEIPGRMQLLAPHLPEIPMDGIEEALQQPMFAPLVTAPTSTDGQPPADQTDPVQTDGQDPTKVMPPTGGFGQPNPGGSQPPVTSGPVGPGDAEYDRAYEAARRGDHSQMQQLYDADRVSEPTRVW